MAKFLRRFWSKHLSLGQGMVDCKQIEADEVAILEYGFKVDKAHRLGKDGSLLFYATVYS